MTYWYHNREWLPPSTPLQWLGHGQGRPLPLAFISAIVMVFVVPSMPCVTAVCTQCRTAAMSTEPLVHHKKNSDCLRKCRKKCMGKNRSRRSYQGRPSALLSPGAPTTHPRHRDVKLRHRNRVYQSRILAVLNTSQGQILGWYFDPVKLSGYYMYRQL
jgi:hypothetical protein